LNGPSCAGGRQSVKHRQKGLWLLSGPDQRQGVVLSCKTNGRWLPVWFAAQPPT
jgi:hypothetical protein